MGESIETRITLLVDNVAGPGLLSELGFAAWIEVAGRRVLFDTGQGSALTGNAGTLGLDLRTVDTLALSHGHYDHTGGVPLVVSGSPSVEIHVHPAATGPRYCIRNGSARPIAMLEASRAALEMHSAHVRWTTHPEQLLPGVGLTGSIPRTTAYEDTGGPFFIDAGGHEPDPIADDQALWICTERGLVVVVGCSHAGLVNTLRHAVTSSGEPRLHAVIGGFHLNEASEQRLACTTDALLELCPDLIVPCHCTGDAAVAKLRRTFGDRVLQGSAGATFRFGIHAAIMPVRTPSQGTA
jgi:7,8-dihydropterin-6-yl-methyl-4-(beta-D-ribofuranosyl)aminobenzene 5'-phosphate synthase